MQWRFYVVTEETASPEQKFKHFFYHYFTSKSLAFVFMWTRSCFTSLYRGRYSRSEGYKQDLTFFLGSSVSGRWARGLAKSQMAISLSLLEGDRKTETATSSACGGKELAQSRGQREERRGWSAAFPAASLEKQPPSAHLGPIWQ